MVNNNRLMELALRGLESEKARIEAEIEELRSQVSGTGPRRRRQMSAAARKRISDAMKKRHAERRLGRPAVSKAGQSSGGLTSAGRKKLSEMMKARWAAKKRAGK